MPGNAPESYLLILQAHENDFLHKRKLRLLVSFRAFTDVPRVECDLVAIGGALVGRFGRPVVNPGSRCWRADTASVLFPIVSSSSSTSSPPREPRRTRSHVLCDCLFRS